MAKFLQTLIPILSLLLAAATAAATPWQTYFSYDFTNAAPIIDLTFQGDARIYHMLHSSFLILTEANTGAVGRVLYTQPVQFWHAGGQIDFETTFTFDILESDTPPAEGIVFFIGPVGSKPPNGGGGGNFGVFESNGYSPGVFAVEFDTYVNDWDPSYRHVGLDFESRVSRTTTNVGNAILNKVVTATIRYAAAKKVINVTVSAGTETFGILYKFDLSAILPQQVQVGLSAATGEKVAIHNVHSWNFGSSMVNKGAAAKSREQLIRQFV